MARNETSRQSAAASRALLVAAVAGILLIPAMFLPWFGDTPLAVATHQGHGDQNAWAAFSKVDVGLLVTAVLGTALALGVWLMARRRGVPGWPLLGGVLVGAGGTIAAAAVFYRMVNAPGNDELQAVLLGAYVGLALTVALALAGWTAAIVGLNAVRRGYVITMAPIVSTPASRQLGTGDAPGAAPAGRRLPR
jgi:uncharacterized membrane protein